MYKNVQDFQKWLFNLYQVKKYDYRKTKFDPEQKHSVSFEHSVTIALNCPFIFVLGRWQYMFSDMDLTAAAS